MKSGVHPLFLLIGGHVSFTPIKLFMHKKIMNKKIEYSNNIFWRQHTSWTATLKDVYCQVGQKRYLNLNYNGKTSF